MAQLRGGLDLAALYRDHHRDVFRFLHLRCRSATLAEDLTQDTFERVVRWAQSHRWQEQGRSPLSLLYAVARNLLLDHLKCHQRRETPHPDFHAADQPVVCMAVEEPVDELVAARLQRTYWRQVIQLAYVEGLCDRDIAARLGLQPGAVKARRLRAVQRLRSCPHVWALADTTTPRPAPRLEPVR
jgi:RNA polymerase sigma-70 factor (ECF subfamily)